MQHLLGCAVLIITVVNVRGISNQNICQDHEKSKIFVTMGERGMVSLVRRSYAPSSRNDLTWYDCKIDLISCPTCVIFTRLRNLNVEVCSNAPINETNNEYKMTFSENSISPQVEYCGGKNNQNTSALHNVTYRSLTKVLSIKFVFFSNQMYNFSLEYFSERNRQNFEGRPGPHNITYGGIIESPYFPAPYPKDLGAEYVIKCETSFFNYCRIKLVFIDFLVPPTSVIEFYDWSGVKQRGFDGTKPRPPILLTSGPSLQVRFFANGVPGNGFRAAYYFITGEVRREVLLPVTGKFYRSEKLKNKMKQNLYSSSS